MKEEKVKQKKRKKKKNREKKKKDQIEEHVQSLETFQSVFLSSKVYMRKNYKQDKHKF